MMPSKESDINIEKTTKDEAEEDEEDYEIDESDNFTTLRKSCGFTFERFSSKD
jgi:hypothetical protein